MTLPARIGRRTFVMNTGVSLGSMALASMLPRTNSAQAAAPVQSGRWTGARYDAAGAARSGLFGFTWPAA